MLHFSVKNLYYSVDLNSKMVVKRSSVVKTSNRNNPNGGLITFEIN